MIKIENHKTFFSFINLIKLLNYDDSFLSLLNKRYTSIVTLRGDNIIIKGDKSEIKILESIFKEMSFIYKKNDELLIEDLSSTIEIIDSNHRTNTKAQNVVNHNDNFIYSGINDIVKNPKL